MAAIPLSLGCFEDQRDIAKRGPNITSDNAIICQNWDQVRSIRSQRRLLTRIEHNHISPTTIFANPAFNATFSLKIIYSFSLSVNSFWSKCVSYPYYFLCHLSNSRRIVISVQESSLLFCLLGWPWASSAHTSRNSSKPKSLQLLSSTWSRKSRR